MKPYRIILPLLGTAILILGGVLWTQRNSLTTTVPSQTLSTSASAPQTLTPAPAPSLSPGKKESAPEKKRTFDPEKEWKEFVKKFGPDLKPVFLKNGQLVSVRGDPAGSNATDPAFRPDDPKKAIARAREILAAAEDLLGLRPDWPLESAATRGSFISAQVFFNETHDGVTVEPVGNIKIDMGSKGELVGLYSDYASRVKITNEVILDSEQAQTKAIATARFQNKETSPRVDGGSKIIWVVSESEGHFAYEFLVNGRKVIIDAQTGDVLFSKDRRHF